MFARLANRLPTAAPIFPSIFVSKKHPIVR